MILISDFFQGYLAGLAMILFIGPVFFLLLSSTLHYGFKAGFAIAVGIIFSDILCATVCFLGLAPFMTNSNNQGWIALAGGGVLIIMGIKYMFGKHKIPKEGASLPSRSEIRFFTKGFLVNFVNPFVWVVWIGLINYSHQSTSGHPQLFLTGTLLGIFSNDLLKVILAKRIKSFVNPHVLIWVYRIVGFLLIAFGIRLLGFFLFQ